jgi:heavy metal sensor kinase
MMLRILDSVRIRLTLWYVVVLALVLIVFSAVVYTLLSRALYQRVEDELVTVIEVATKSLIRDTEEGQTSKDAALSIAAARRTAAELFNSEQSLAIFDGSGALLAENVSDNDFRAELPDSDLTADQQFHFYTVTEDDGDDNHRVAVRRVSIPPANTPYVILTAQELDPIEDELQSLREIFYYSLPLTIIAVGIGGWFLARKSLAPVVSMSEQARHIGAHNLDRRLPVANERDELGQLAVTFNELLSRLNSAFSRQRQFMADASHELRTPLSVMRTTTGVTLEQRHRDEDEYREALKVIDEQIGRLVRVVEDMFTLARADAGRYPLHQRSFYLDELLVETARAARVLSENRNVSLELDQPSESLFYGDEDLLRRMFLNLLDNAIKHTPPGGIVRVSLARQGQDYLIWVSDTGAGIPPEAQSHIFERFYRADKARARAEAANGGGAGLGLAISRWVAEAHNGSLELVKSDPTGSTFVASLPVPAAK